MKGYFSFLKSTLKQLIDIVLSDGLRLKGVLDVEVRKNGILVDSFCGGNIVLNNPKQKIAESFTTGAINPVFRMAIGDDGAMSSDLFQPKIPTADMTALFHEVYRKDLESYTVGDKQVQFVCNFNSLDVPDTSFNNASKRYINEVMLIMGDGVYGGGDVAAPAVPDADESGFSIRCTKSVPFDAADNITITYRWTIFVQ